ncbi:MAG: AMP-binding protein [Pseudomonadota bacterium]
MAWFAKRPLTVADVIRCSAEANRDKPAVECNELEVSWRAFDTGTCQVGNALLNLGLSKGDRVVVLMSNSYEMVEAMFGIIRAGLCAVPLNCSITNAAVAGMIDNSGAKAVIASGEHLHRIESLRADLPGPLNQRLVGVQPVHEGWLDYQELRSGGAEHEPPIRVSPQDECNIIYSSGTTGLPKGIVHDHGCREAWGSDMAVALRYHAGCRTLINLGLFSNISWVAMLATFFAGGTLIIQNRFDVAATLSCIQDRRVTHSVMVPLQFQKLIESPELSQYDLSSLDSYMCCGSPLAPHLKRRIHEQLPGDFIELYGLTEGLVTILSPEDMSEHINSVGRACPGQRLAILNDDDTLAAAGEPGEIIGHSRFLMAGYHASDAANEEATWTDDSGLQWLRTGDIGHLDEHGFLYLVDRKKDMIISGGQNIFPADIESTMVEHDAISEIAVIGVPHEKWGETPLAVVVPTSGKPVDADELIGWANAQLGKQQRIRGLVFVDELPRNPNGKVLKRELRDRYKDHAAHG